MIKHHVPTSSVGQSRWIQVVTRLPSRARCPCSGIGQEVGVDGVADLALERTAGLARCVACRRLTSGNRAAPATSHVHVGQISQALAQRADQTAAQPARTEQEVVHAPDRQQSGPTDRYISSQMRAPRSAMSITLSSFLYAASLCDTNIG
jgi:hypothetical protein